ncbi:cytochrome c biogenesis protein ResB [Salisediminibacterium halotolerans]|uniref:cytochrome c biogenesis protein ResB n=1 Tax=Salisediminibacterium halotolerans TaxID=517425 RepID=UPI000EB563A1|nr:cytochrome c biogenesis protein ResB [Salisediminibacterium halotolerans]RLJ77988.1 cytochrome c biogenesis protein [Actinophytocola xinjiangensis]RPE88674.1 cytochrome c biogenesis protein [Salisediminibacterium halotolerans]TWG36965.1 cytochrome c biogenesis protein [Salisediminibacterium halotolerans]GEL08422.1 cytochrome c biogenesis protein [Salisediminibacterium halotolerans]
MEKVKCECGHENPYGTYLCESCGKPLKEEEGKLANMRYEGTARRSQTYRKNVVDKIWNFFSSVKVGIWIIIILLIASSLGTVFPQEMYIPPAADPSVYYYQEYGTLGQLYYQLGFHNLYGSWWYILILAALGISLVIASLDRVVPLYRALRKQRVTRHSKFLERQRLYAVSEETYADPVQKLDEAAEALKKKRYNVRRENGHLLAEKNRFARWGPYVNHVGLIIFLIGGMLRFFPEMYVDESVWVREGETEIVQGTDGEYYIHNNEFIVEYYDDERDDQFQEALENQQDPVVETYETQATLLKPEAGGTIGSETDLEKIKDHDIRVNDPLTYDGYSLYQVDYKLNEFSKFTFALELDDEEIAGTEFTVDLNDPAMSYDLADGYTVEIMEYFPNFEMDENNEPTTINRVPDNPRIIFEVFPPDLDPDDPDTTGEISFLGVQLNEALTEDNEYAIRLTDADLVDVTGLTVRRDRTLPFLIAGGAIFMIGLIQGSYWHHRRIWAQHSNGKIIVAGHANKNWYALKKDFQYAHEQAGLPYPDDQAELNEEEGGSSENGSTKQ